MLRIYNTLSRKKEDFRPIHPPKVGMYSCGPTVYNYAHIGNLRTYVFEDVLRRVLSYDGFKVIHAMNITDVDDKTIRASQKEKTGLKEFTEKYERIFFEDLEGLNILKPARILRATESIGDIANIIKALMKKGYAYKTSDGIYFSIAKSKNYGKLAQLERSKAKKGRISGDEYDKESANDFALWKFRTKEDGNVFWKTEFGEGRPGWHIECSAMSMKALGETFDIHTGAVDLIFPHHTNEIAQSEAATGKQFARYWMHGGFLTMEKEKMAKSLGNVLYLGDLKKKGFSPMEFRHMCLAAHYRSQMAFSSGGLEAAKNAYARLKNIISELKDDGKTNKKYLDEFESAINDDLDMPKALSALWGMLRDRNAEGKLRAVREMDKVLGLKLLEKEKASIPKDILKLAKEREDARKNRDWKKSDELRERIRSMGWRIDDAPGGAKIRKS